jgi:hypothetical protein
MAETEAATTSVATKISVVGATSAGTTTTR